MSFAKSRPQVRNIEPQPIEHNGERLVHLRDPLNYTDATLSVTLPAYFLMTMMDGKNSVEQIRDSFNKTYKGNATLEDMENLVKALEEALFLNNEEFEKKKEAVISGFREAPLRESALAGNSYPAEPEKISALLDGYLDGFKPSGKPPFALVAPHIDLRAGGKCFGKAFSQLKDSKAETFIILGIGHALGDDFFACIDKGFKTPLGVCPVDMEFLENLESGFGEPIYGEAFVHKSEHSIEFQVLFLQKIFGDANPPKKIVPILLSFPENLSEIDDPRFNQERVDRFIGALRKGIEKLGDKACVIAGIDLSHVGKRFGEADGAPKERLEEIEKQDREALALIAEGKKDEFVELMKKINPTNHICGFPALYVLLDLLDGQKGNLLDYKQNVEGENDSVVSFAAMTFG